MEADLISTSAYGLGSLWGFVGSVVTLPFYLVLLLLLAFVLYYFTGENKKADSFVPSIMSHFVRIFNYFWLFTLSVIGFQWLGKVLGILFTFVVPNTTVTNANQNLVTGFVYLAIVALLAAGVIHFGRYVNTLAGNGGTVSTKLFVFAGLITFSLLTFANGMAVLENVLRVTRGGTLNVADLGFLFAAVIVLALYVVKSIEVIKTERN